MADEEVKEALSSEEHEAEGGVPDENFAELFEKSSRMATRLDPGQKVKARVAGLSGDVLYVDLGGKSEGVVAMSEFAEQEGVEIPVVGDEIDVYFVTVDNGVKKFTTLVRGYSTVTLAGIRDAHEAGLPVTGTVGRAVKGGFEVMIGKVRSFCPFSQIDLKGAANAEGYVGQTYAFRVLEFAEDGANVILSRRALLEEEQQARLAELKAGLAVDQEIPVRVKSLQKFGVFVDLGGIDGLIPMSELAWGGIDDPTAVLSLGQEVTVKVISVDWDRNRITLSLKALQEDPWIKAAERYPLETMVRGPVVRLTPFGAFVNLEPGVDGLIHVSKLGAGRRVKHPQDVLEVGQWVEARVIKTDPVTRRISLSMENTAKGNETALPAVGEIINGTVEKVMPFGIFVRLDENVTGLVPNAEAGTPRGANHAKIFPAGSTIQVLVLEVDKERGRITLSKSKVEEKMEEDALASYRDNAAGPAVTSNTGLGSLGELFKAKWEDLQRGR
jgi:small subunit ribosomal protein S1